MVAANQRNIWVFVEQTLGKLAAGSLEVLGKAYRLGQEAGLEVSAVLLGENVGHLAEELLTYGPAKVLLVDDSRLKYYQNDSYSAVLRKLIKRDDPDIVLFGASSVGEELAPTLAAQLKTGLAAHCTDLSLKPDGLLSMMVPAFGGRILGEIFCPTQRPQMASVKPGTFILPERRESLGALRLEDAYSLLSDSEIKLETIKVVTSEPSGLPLEQAEVVVAGGYGVGSKENWQLLEELAKELNGAVGCTRPALDEGWTAGEHTMIGTSGKTVRPKVYLGFGISGATHHFVGIKDSGVIINVNRDTKAPALAYSDYYVAEDFLNVAPALLEEIRRINKSS